MATNRADTLDPALLRPGRLDRKIEFPMPDRRQKRLIFATITGKMNLSEDVDLEDYVARPDRISGADINAICQEVSHLRLEVIGLSLLLARWSGTHYRLSFTICQFWVFLDALLRRYYSRDISASSAVEMYA